MTVQIGRFTPYETLATRALARTAAPAHGAPAAVGAHQVDTIVGDVPPVPTPGVRAEVERAAERVDELHSQSRELHFAKDPSSQRVIIEVRDLDGNVIKTIPPSKALHVMAGRGPSGAGMAPKLPGMAGGLDTDSIIQQLMQGETRRTTMVWNRQSQVKQHQTLLTTVKTKVDALKTAAAA